ncbi:MAG: MFS transporter [Bacteroidota bacterium]|nr:MFS transporter [Bacteroidota bacterium]
MSKLGKVMSKFPKSFWVANSMELFERWAWYGLFNLLALYLTNSVDEGALGFTQTQKGMIMGTVTAILYFLPIITGSMADRFGYRKMLILSFIILGSGYYLMGTFTTYGAVFFAFLYVAVGAAMFKPIIAATVAKTTTDKTSSIGFGIFYMMINIGGFLGPVFSSKLRHDMGWGIIFVMAASVIAINMLLVLFLFKEPDRKKSTEKFLTSVKESFFNIYKALKDLKLAVFLLIMVGFWTLFNQLFYTLPNFIDQWVNTSILYNNIASISPALASAFGTDEGTVAPEMFINLDAGFIILFQLIISTLVMRFKSITSIVSGLLVVALGIGLAFATDNGMFVVLAILIFSIGEMASSPKFTEYIGKIAPKNKEALYMGTSFLPIAVGNYFAGIVSGPVYERTSDKISLLRREMISRGHDLPEIGKGYTQNDFIDQSAELLNTDASGITQLLWENYNPSRIWYVFAGIGLLTAVSLLLYNKFMLKGEEPTRAAD